MEHKEEKTIWTTIKDIFKKMGDGFEAANNARWPYHGRGLTPPKDGQKTPKNTG